MTDMVVVRPAVVRTSGRCEWTNCDNPGVVVLLAQTRRDGVSTGTCTCAEHAAEAAASIVRTFLVMNQLVDDAKPEELDARAKVMELFV